MSLNKRTITSGLVFAALVLMVLNLIMMFFPFLEYRLPSQSKTTIFGTEYIGWYTKTIVPYKIIIPLLVFALPIAFCIRSFLTDLANKGNKNPLAGIINDNLDAPCSLSGIKFGAVLNILTMIITRAIVNADVDLYIKHGSYCKLTGTGKASIAFSIALYVVLAAITILSKGLVKPAAVAVADGASEEAAETTETGSLAQENEEKTKEEDTSNA